VALPFKVSSSSQAKQLGSHGRRLDYNWATTHIASLPTGNSGGCPHHSPLLNKGPALIPLDRGGVPDLSVSGDKSHLVVIDPHDLTTTSKHEAPMQSLNQLPMVTDLVGARSS
jgi:hypothetical protein